MITVNGTSGLSAIYHGVSLLLIVGNALYSHNLLVTCAWEKSDFNSFWSFRKIAPESVRCSYIHWLKETSLQTGDFFTPEATSCI